MARTTEAAVTLAIDTTLTTPQIEAFIDDASAVVDDIAAADTTITTAKLTLIEKYLACHFVTLRDPRIRSGEFGDTSETYQRDTKVTEYLKAAMGLDPTGIIRGQFMDAKPFKFRAGAGYA